MDDFPDVNVWVALSSPDHDAHSAAKTYFETQASERLFFCWITAIGLVRVTSQPHTFGGHALSPKEAWQNFRRWLSRDDVGLLPDPPNLADLLDLMIQDGHATPRAWTDLYLAAFSLGANLRLVTFDTRFERIPGVRVMTLES